MHKAAEIKKLTLAMTLLAFSAFQSAQAAVPDATLSSKLTAAKVLPKGAVHRLVRTDGDNLRVEISHYPTLDEKTQKIDALLIARTILHADPGGVTSIVTRFFIDSEPYTYHDVLVSNRDIVGADAGILGSDALLGGIGVVTIRANDSVEQRFSKYCVAAENALRKEDFHESENLFAIAYRESPDVAKSDAKYFSGLAQLAQAYSGREDADDEERIYRKIVAALPCPSSPDALKAVRDTYNYYFNKGNYPNAEKVARSLVNADKKPDGDPSDDYAADLQLLAACHRRQGQVADARREYQEVLSIRQKQVGDSHPALGDVFEGIGDCFNDEKNSVSALEFWKRAKVSYDHAAVTKDTKHRISYETYRSIIHRINEKIALGSQKKRF